jgi:hypothetical protein
MQANVSESKQMQANVTSSKSIIKCKQMGANACKWQANASKAKQR